LSVKAEATSALFPQTLGRHQLIDPALKDAGWDEHEIRREVKVTHGRLYLVGDEAHRRKPLWADYVLSWDDLPIAVIEAKDDSHR
jgi:type I restriction enzyme R subunit